MTGEPLPPFDVTVVIVTHNSSAVITGLLDSLEAGLAPYRAEVIVVDNASTDRTRDVVSARKDCRLVLSENVGYAAAINAGVDAGSGSPAILVLNPDTVVHPGAASHMLSALREPGVGIVAPMTLDAAGGLMLTQRREPTLLRASGLSRLGWSTVSEHVGDRAAYGRRQVVDWAVGAALMIDRGCHQSLGGWDSSFFLYSEETDFCLRAREHGFLTVYVPQAVVTHDAGGSGRSPRTHSMQVINRVRLYGRRHRRATTTAYFGLILAGESVRAVRRGGQGSRRAVRDLLRPAGRPPELGASHSLIPH